MQTRINISAELVNWIMACVHFEFLSPQISQQLIDWQEGSKQPTYNQIEKVSRATGIPLGYFFLQTPPKEDMSLINYRTIDSVELTKPSRNLMDTIHDMEKIQEWMRDNVIRENGTILSFVGSLRKCDDIIQFVNELRKALEIEVTWFKQYRTVDDLFRKLREKISSTGVVVMMSGIVRNNTHRLLDSQEFRAFTLIDEYAPLIFINSDDSICARLFSLLHEYAHVWIGSNSLFNDRFKVTKTEKNIETLCNAVAAEILVPLSIFRKEYARIIQDCKKDEALYRLASYFKCGVIVIARKALDQGYISKALYDQTVDRAIQQYLQTKKDKQHGGDYYRTVTSRIDKRFLDRLLGSISEGKTLYTDAYRLTNTNRVTFNKLTEYIRGNYE
jgi:Zn-dependent peptidase ImmA (M78 family)